MILTKRGLIVEGWYIFPKANQDWFCTWVCSRLDMTSPESTKEFNNLDECVKYCEDNTIPDENLRAVLESEREFLNGLQEHLKEK